MQQVGCALLLVQMLSVIHAMLLLCPGMLVGSEENLQLIRAVLMEMELGLRMNYWGGASFSMYTNRVAKTMAGMTRPVMGTRTEGAHDGGTKG